ncbi:hypothetical protein GOODEAATRI_005635 [Goodea atripinnis]|uniref:Uncharacterized protein n=1 Tax=Goodea atripinnis TaxID=208336 RepID=A0ABV0PVK8_9TELE
MLSQDFQEEMKFLDLEDVSQYIRNISTPMLVSIGAVAAATTYYLATRPKALPPVCDLHMQSIEAPGSDYVHSSVLLKGESYLTHIYEDARTMYESFVRGARVSSKSKGKWDEEWKLQYGVLTSVLRLNETIKAIVNTLNHSTFCFAAVFRLAAC